MVTAIILAGGVGSRVGAGIPKQFIEVLGKPILAYTLDIYQQHPEVDAIEVVCHASYIEYCKDMCVKYGHTKVRWICNGGETFQDSCMNGIYHLQDKITKDDTIMIHYGGAPFTTQDELTDAIRVAKEKGNAVCGIPCFQLMGTRDKVTDERPETKDASSLGISPSSFVSECSKEWVDRDQFIQITCPYCFNYGFVLDLYEEAKEKDLLDKVEPHTTTLMQYMGYPLYLSKGYQSNMKITTKEDLKMFEGWCLANAI